MGRLRTTKRLFGDLFEFMNKDKLWWMSPILLMLVVVGAFLIVVQGSALAPLIYAMF